MRQCTLLFLCRENELLLAMKKRGFGAGKWNGVGGKVESGETIEQALVRECQEEIDVTPESFRKVAVLDFVFEGGEHDMTVHAFVCDKWQGEPVETEEMAPRWTALDAIPYDDMWQDDPYWLPQVLAGKLVRGTFTFDKGDTMLAHDMRFVDALEDPITSAA